MILLGSNHYSSAVSSFNTHSIDLERSSGQYLNITDGSQSGLDITGDITIELWVKWETLYPSNNSYFVSKWLGTGNQRGYALIYNGPTSSILFTTSADGTSGTQVNLSLSYTFTTNTWYHVALTYDASAGTAELFINGVSQTTASGGATSLFNNTADFKIGWNDTVNTFDGLIDDLRVWSDIRTDAEIANNFNKQLVGNEAGLVGYWQLNNSPNDLTSNGNDLTENNSPTYSTTVPFLADGANTHSIDLESSSSQYLSASDSASLSITGDMTIEFWATWESTIDPNRYLVSKWNGTGNQRSYNLWHNSSNELIFRISKDGNNAPSTSSSGQTTLSFTPTLDTWYHIAVTYNATGQSAEWFINGISQGSGTYDRTLPNAIFDSSADFNIGFLQNIGRYHDGLIDDVRIWDDIRTSTEISNNMNKELVGNEANLQGYWKLNNNANDSTSNGNDLTENNSPVYSTTVPF